MSRNRGAAQAERPRVRTARPTARLVQGKTDWYRLLNATGDTAEIYIYDEIGYWGTTAAGFVEELKAVAASTIKLFINSPGGDVFDGLAIYNALKRHSATVDVFVDGLAASAASFIAQAGDTVTVARNAMIMIHDAWGFSIGNAADMREMANLLDQHSDNIADIYAQRAGGTVQYWRDAMLAETWYSGSEAVDAGLADEMTDPDEETSAKLKNDFDLSVFAYAGRDAAPDPKIPDNEASGTEPETGALPDNGENDATESPAESPAAAAADAPAAAAEEAAEEDPAEGSPVDIESLQARKLMYERIAAQGTANA